jgi:hypothetical protein
VSDGFAPGGGRHHFFEAISLSIALSSSASANSFFSLACVRIFSLQDAILS